MLNEIINVDLHVHSNASLYKDGRIVSNSTKNHLDMLFNKLQEFEIGLFAFTDHNRFDKELFKEAQKMIASGKYPVVKNLIAGVEFDVAFKGDKSPAHIIALFDTNNDDNNLDSIQIALDHKPLVDRTSSYSEEEFNSIIRNISLRTILIAHQHEGLFIEPKKIHSLATATNHAREMLYFGYIDALEFNNQKVQGILKSDFHELDISSSAVIGSDCHEWSAYPAHDSSQTAKSAFCTRMKCLPSFQGLLMAFTSPNTRLQPSTQTWKPTHIKEFHFNGQTIPLSPGLNAIVGENGSGKSSLLELLINQKCKEVWIKNFCKTNNIVTNPLNDSSKVKMVHQGDLRNKYDNNALIDPENYDVIDNSHFESAIKQYSNTLKSILKNNIEAESNLQTLRNATFRICPDLEATTYEIRISIPANFTDGDNTHKSRADAIRKITNALLDEKLSKYYTNSELIKLDDAIKNINELLAIIEIREKYANILLRAKNTIKLRIEEYRASINKHKTDRDDQIVEYRKLRHKFIESIIRAAKDSVKPPPALPKIILKETDGASKTLKNGFSFVKTAAYRNETGIEEALLATLFNKNFLELSSILSIKNQEQIGMGVRNANAANWEAIWDNNIQRFFDEYEKTECSILDMRSKTMLGNTLGEQSLTFYKYETYNNEGWDVMVVDQPEDDISHNRINVELIDYFNNVRSSHQIIMVTHNPLLVVNQDVDNVIVLDQNGGTTSILAGCLESDGILDKVASHMDGGRHAIAKRLKAYGFQGREIYHE